MQGWDHRKVGHSLHNLLKALERSDFIGVAQALLDPDFQKFLQEKDPSRQAYRMLHDVEDYALSKNQIIKATLELLAILEKK